MPVSLEFLSQVAHIHPSYSLGRLQGLIENSHFVFSIVWFEIYSANASAELSRVHREEVVGRSARSASRSVGRVSSIGRSYALIVRSFHEAGLVHLC